MKKVICLSLVLMIGAISAFASSTMNTVSLKSNVEMLRGSPPVAVTSSTNAKLVPTEIAIVNSAVNDVGLMQAQNTTIPNMTARAIIRTTHNAAANSIKANKIRPPVATLKSIFLTMNAGATTFLTTNSITDANSVSPPLNITASMTGLANSDFVGNMTTANDRLDENASPPAKLVANHDVENIGTALNLSITDAANTANPPSS